MIILSVHWATTHQNESEISNREAVLGEHNGAAARKLTATYMQIFYFYCPSLTLHYFIIQHQVNIKEAVSLIMMANIVLDERYPQRWNIQGKKTLWKIKSHNK